VGVLHAEHRPVAQEEIAMTPTRRSAPTSSFQGEVDGDCRTALPLRLPFLGWVK
jgi:hypothetical protein